MSPQSMLSVEEENDEMDAIRNSVSSVGMASLPTSESAGDAKPAANDKPELAKVRSSVDGTSSSVPISISLGRHIGNLRRMLKLPDAK